MARTGLHIERKTDMFGCCKTINAYHGNWNEFGGAVYDFVAKTWTASLYDAKRECHDFEVAGTNDEPGLQHVEALISLFYRQHYSTIHRVAARYLSRGDMTGSGETIVGIAVGARTPRGKVEVTLEKDGNRRLALWGASTVINVRRAA